MRKIVVTGAARGIGLAICKAFKSEGDYVIGIDITDKECDYIYYDEFLNLDLEAIVKNPEGYKSLFDKHKCIDVLINNAAIQIVKPFSELQVDDWKKTFNINVFGPIVLTQILLSKLKISNGLVINMSSIHKKLTKPEFSAYASSKHTIYGLTKSLALEFGDQIRFLSISPAAISTDMLFEGFNHSEEEVNKLSNLHPTKCIGTPTELANFIYSISSKKFKFLNGTDLEFDGGISSALLDAYYL